MYNFLSSFLKEDQLDLLSSIMSIVAVLYNEFITLIIYPAFTFLFFLCLSVFILLITFAIKHYLKKDYLASGKLLFFSILCAILSLDVYLIALGKAAVFLLMLKIQKDIFFAIIACAIGIFAGKFLFSGTKNKKNIP